MSTQDQLKALQAEIESHVANLRQLRKQETMDDASDKTLEHYAEAIKFLTWGIGDIQNIVIEAESAWPEPDGYRIDGSGLSIPTTR